MTATPQDVVGVFSDGGDLAPLFEGAHVMRALVNEDAKVMDHPMESGAVSSDHIVFLPTEIDLHVILAPEDYADTYQQIKAKWKAAETVSVQTKTDTYASMLITRIPHDEESEMANTVAMGIKLRQVIIIKAQYAQLPPAQVQKPANSSTTKTGQKAPTPASTGQTKKASTLYGAFFGKK